MVHAARCAVLQPTGNFRRGPVVFRSLVFRRARISSRSYAALLRPVRGAGRPPRAATPNAPPASLAHASLPEAAAGRHAGGRPPQAGGLLVLSVIDTTPPPRKHTNKKQHKEKIEKKAIDSAPLDHNR